MAVRAATARDLAIKGELPGDVELAVVILVANAAP
jgi:hypothetical protein